MTEKNSRLRRRDPVRRFLDHRKSINRGENSGNPEGREGKAETTTKAGERYPKKGLVLCKEKATSRLLIGSKRKDSHVEGGKKEGGIQSACPQKRGKSSGTTRMGDNRQSLGEPLRLLPQRKKGTILRMGKKRSKKTERPSNRKKKWTPCSTG